MRSLVTLARSSVFVVSVTGVAAFGCVKDNRFDPSGCDAHLRSSWTVEGQDPRILVNGECAKLANGDIDRTRNEICDPNPSADNIGIAEVRLFLYNPDTDEPWRDPGDLLLFNCNPCLEPRSPDQNIDGGVPSFLDSDSDEIDALANAPVRRVDRCGGTGELLTAGTYDYQWIAFSGIGQPIDCTPVVEGFEFGMDADAGVIELPPVDFSQSSGVNRCPTGMMAP